MLHNPSLWCYSQLVGHTDQLLPTQLGFRRPSQSKKKKKKQIWSDKKNHNLMLFAIYSIAINSVI